MPVDHPQGIPESSGPVTGNLQRVVGDRARPGRRRRGSLIVALLVGVLLLAGCQTTAWVRVDVNPDGSGSVTVDVYLDAEAAAQVGDLSKMVRVEDLKRDGWKVIGPAPRRKVMAELGGNAGTVVEGGAVQIHLEHPFADVDEANGILQSLSGPDGPLTDVALSRHSSLFRTDLRFTGTVDLSHGLDTFGDVDLTKVLGGSLADTVAASGEQAPSSNDLRIGLQIESRSSLDWSGEMGNESMGNETVSAVAGLGDTPESVDVHASKIRWGAVITAAVLIGLVLVGLVLVGFRWRRRANRAERSLLPDIEVTDPFVGPGHVRPDDVAPSGAGANGSATADGPPPDGGPGDDPPETPDTT